MWWREMAKRENVVLAFKFLSRTPGQIAGGISEKKHHVDGAVDAVNLPMSPVEIRFLEETYQPHALTRIMAQSRYGRGGPGGTAC